MSVGQIFSSNALQAPTADGRIVVRLNRGLGFGTGDHGEDDAKRIVDFAADLPKTASGKVFFTMAGTRYVCSGAVVNDGRAAYSLVLTAGHCTYDETGAAFATQRVCQVRTGHRGDNPWSLRMCGVRTRAHRGLMTTHEATLPTDDVQFETELVARAAACGPTLAANAAHLARLLKESPCPLSCLSPRARRRGPLSPRCWRSRPGSTPARPAVSARTSRVPEPADGALQGTRPRSP